MENKNHNMSYYEYFKRYFFKQLPDDDRII